MSERHDADFLKSLRDDASFAGDRSAERVFEAAYVDALEQEFGPRVHPVLPDEPDAGEDE